MYFSCDSNPDASYQRQPASPSPVVGRPVRAADVVSQLTRAIILTPGFPAVSSSF